MGKAMRKIGDTIESPIKTSKSKKIQIDESYKDLTLTELRKEYEKIAIEKKKLEDGAFCHTCNKHLPRDRFYVSNTSPSGLVPMCKGCLFKIATNYDEKTKEGNETEESLKKALKIANRPFIRSAYEASCNAIYNETSGKQRGYIWGQYITIISTMSQWADLTWDNSDEELDLNSETEEIKLNNKIIKSGRKRFGAYPPEDLMFLENEYQDWTQRYACENKAQELLFKRICFKELDIDKAQRAGADTKELDKSLQQLMGSLSVKPSQNNSNTFTEAQTFGQLIQLWENEQPVPEPEEEFKDVDRIGLYIDVFFKGHLSKMMGLKNAFSNLYEKFMKKYTVTKPEYDEDTDLEVLFDQIFETKMEDETDE